MGEKHVWSRPYFPTLLLPSLLAPFMILMITSVNIVHMLTHATHEKSKIGMMNSNEGFLAIGSSQSLAFLSPEVPLLNFVRPCIGQDE